MDLLAHLRKSHGNRPVQGAAAEPKRITLKRKTHSEIKMAGGGGGQIKTVSVEVRKKRTMSSAVWPRKTPPASASPAGRIARTNDGRGRTAPS